MLSGPRKKAEGERNAALRQVWRRRHNSETGIVTGRYASTTFTYPLVIATFRDSRYQDHRTPRTISNKLIAALSSRSIGQYPRSSPTFHTSHFRHHPTRQVEIRTPSKSAFNLPTFPPSISNACQVATYSLVEVLRWCSVCFDPALRDSPKRHHTCLRAAVRACDVVVSCLGAA